jgi:hypothetical protein
MKFWRSSTDGCDLADSWILDDGYNLADIWGIADGYYLPGYSGWESTDVNVLMVEACLVVDLPDPVNATRLRVVTSPVVELGWWLSPGMLLWPGWWLITVWW